MSDDPAVEAPPPANLMPYIEALGVEDALHFFLALGGSEIYLPQKSSPRSLAARSVGAAQVDKLAAAMGPGYVKVPLARQWVARVMLARGESLAEIARTVRADVATVRRWLGAAPRAVQLDLFADRG